MKKISEHWKIIFFLLSFLDNDEYFVEEIFGTILFFSFSLAFSIHYALVAQFVLAKNFPINSIQFEMKIRFSFTLSSVRTQSKRRRTNVQLFSHI